MSQHIQAKLSNQSHENWVHFDAGLNELVLSPPVLHLPAPQLNIPTSCNLNIVGSSQLVCNETVMRKKKNATKRKRPALPRIDTSVKILLGRRASATGIRIRDILLFESHTMFLTP